MSLRPLTPALLALLHALARLRTATIRALHEDCAGTVTYQTTATRMTRLQSKGYVQVRRDRGRLLYSLSPECQATLRAHAAAAERSLLATRALLTTSNENAQDT